jgi:hypothetical protein
MRTTILAVLVFVLVWAGASARSDGFTVHFNRKAPPAGVRLTLDPTVRQDGAAIFTSRQSRMQIEFDLDPGVDAADWVMEMVDRVDPALLVPGPPRGMSTRLVVTVNGAPLELEKVDWGSDTRQVLPVGSHLEHGANRIDFSLGDDSYSVLYIRYVHVGPRK